MPFLRCSGVLLHPTSLSGRIRHWRSRAERLRVHRSDRVCRPADLAGVAAGANRLRRFAVPVVFCLCRQPAADQPRPARSKMDCWTDQRPAAVRRRPAASTTSASSLIVEPCGHGCWTASTRVDRRFGDRFDRFCHRGGALVGRLCLFMAVKDAHGQVAVDRVGAGHRGRAIPQPWRDGRRAWRARFGSTS